MGRTAEPRAISVHMLAIAIFLCFFIRHTDWISLTHITRLVLLYFYLRNAQGHAVAWVAVNCALFAWTCTATFRIIDQYGHYGVYGAALIAVVAVLFRVFKLLPSCMVQCAQYSLLMKVFFWAGLSYGLGHVESVTVMEVGQLVLMYMVASNVDHTVACMFTHEGNMHPDTIYLASDLEGQVLKLNVRVCTMSDLYMAVGSALREKYPQLHVDVLAGTSLWHSPGGWVSDRMLSRLSTLGIQDGSIIRVSISRCSKGRQFCTVLCAP